MDDLESLEALKFSNGVLDWLDTRFEEVNERRVDPGRDSEFGELTIYEGLNEGERVFYFESNVFENLVGYNMDDLVSRMNENYSVRKDIFDNADSRHYGNGWALFYWEE